jgi:hypothetical protein
VAKSKYKHRKASSPARAAILDAFTAHDLEVWATRSTDVQGYYDRVYYDLERQRAAHYDELCSALRGAPGIEVPVDRWVRVTDIRDAGFEAVLYPSQQGGETCLAVFPENFRASASRIEVIGDMPPGASCTVLDKVHLCLDR